MGDPGGGDEDCGRWRWCRKCLSRDHEEEPVPQVHYSGPPECDRRNHYGEHLNIYVDISARVFTRNAQYWNHNEPKAISDDQVTIQAHDFFTPQPVKDADIFLLRYILHDWSNSKAIEILKRLREAAVPGKTRVLVVDGIIQYACAVDNGKISGLEHITSKGPGKKNEVPAGLLPNLGRAGARNYCLDLTCGHPPRVTPDYSFPDEILGC